jgi:hypothetical protein
MSTPRSKEFKVKYNARRRANRAALKAGEPIIILKPGRKKSDKPKVEAAKKAVKQPKPKKVKLVVQKVVKARKPDKPILKETKLVIPKDNPDAIKVRLDAKTEVLALPGYDIDQLRAKYGIKKI